MTVFRSYTPPHLQQQAQTHAALRPAPAPWCPPSCAAPRRSAAVPAPQQTAWIEPAMREFTSPPVCNVRVQKPLWCAPQETQSPSGVQCKRPEALQCATLEIKNRSDVQRKIKSARVCT
eukprot:1159390-Pelagomonas_calceolata.AAC.2